MKINAISNNNYKAQNKSQSNNNVGCMSFGNRPNQTIASLKTIKKPANKLILAMIAGLAILSPTAIVAQTKTQSNEQSTSTSDTRLRDLQSKWGEKMKNKSDKNFEVGQLNIELMTNVSKINVAQSNVNFYTNSLSTRRNTLASSEKNLESLKRQLKQPNISPVTASMVRSNCTGIETFNNKLKLEISDDESKKRKAELEISTLKERNIAIENRLSILNNEILMLADEINQIDDEINSLK